MVQQIIIAPHSGFCEGVKSAVNRALHVAANKKNGRVILEGELVHNRDVNEWLYARGIALLQRDLDIQKEDTIIIRAHGISPQRRFYLEHFGCEIVDCTCPFVRHIAKIIEAHSTKPIILLGDRNHVEVEGLCGYSKHICVCENLAECSRLIDAVQQSSRSDECDHRSINFSKIDDGILVCQSTLDVDFLKAVHNLCDKKNFPIKFFDTICGATRRRQLGLRTLENCDAVIVVGGKHSANTKRLYEKMKQKIVAVFWIENNENLAEIDLNPYKKIGIAAGTSTPQSVLQNIYGEISKK
ncbi:MAG: 4-hydroxy-3-methylbut-2-enyl diphosphate reductase [Puniceicoccales bacterium]|jgi:4-hydroxy-3-methylbut-2-enyl diphosphate reductase|nr:4-hydroxy-3-methylbut-2-enyl diphosphate reductase [Puniceicoccales bacterium]